MDNIVKLKQIQKRANWTQAELAQALDISLVALNNLINGKAKPRKSTILKIDKLYIRTIGNSEIDQKIIERAKKQALVPKITVKEIINNQELLDKLTLHLTYHTNTIEGSTMTLSDVKRVFADDDLVLANKTAREQLEARNHRTALNYLLEQLYIKGDDFQWSEELILNVHLRLMNSLISNAGFYRNHSVRIMGSSVALANYLKIPNLIKDLIEQLNQIESDPIRQMAKLHARFEQTHPFSDGNGRTGRLIMFIQALRYQLMPPLVIKERKYAYYKYLEIAQTKGKYDSLEFFVAESMIFTAELIGDNKSHKY